MNDLMIHVELIIVGLIGLIGFIFNWLLILAIQRKTYYYQQHQRLHQITGTGTTPVTTPFITHSSISTLNGLQQAAVEGGAHIQSTKTSTLDKFILSLLINDIFVCNFLIPLHLIDLSSGLPCDFLCYTSKFIEKLSTVIELVIITLLIITSFFYFSKKRFKSLKHQPAIERICFCSIILLLPLVGIYIAGTFSVTANEQQYLKINRSSCQKTYVYIQESTQTTLNWLCFIFTYLIASFDLILLIKIKLSIKNWTLRNVKNVSRHGEQSYSENSYPMHSISSDMRSRTLLNYYDFHQAQATPPNRSPPLDYSNYINISEFAGDIHTLGNSTFLLLFLYVLSYVPYWTHETSGQESLTTSSILSLIQNDLYLFTHAIKPLCYLITQKKLRSHIWAILQCKTFRILPQLLRRKSRMIAVNNNILGHNTLQY
ncbi:unnamed protein product [Didymodactylos carnosus]|uniref:G-protein coupled receptors family 1 profile domain-containing protein n=1 Tax=Didymodactylos carnosus TaxID=1234261 RepID=A0A814CT71_9BILA|nr:unnamed protein product [Didymodactylos carnosus]CAF1156856.1 unnamed protein product [Didymodactylos carnosus]CAF3722687.1 unnamed protein product [Didymodactylos carnosus]CAF3968306.1 unnamed protein product [Didymodactylos carnosus]